MCKVFTIPFLMIAFLSQPLGYLIDYLDQSGQLTGCYSIIMPILQRSRVKLGEMKCLAQGLTVGAEVLVLKTGPERLPSQGLFTPRSLVGGWVGG